MSQENVEIVLTVQPAPEVDCVPLFRDESRWTEFAEAIRPVIHPDVECVLHEFGGDTPYVGLEGIRSFMLDWMAPWVTYRIEKERVIDLGEQVVVLNNDRGRREDSAEDVRGRVGVVWTIHDGKIARLVAYTTHADALQAVGLEE
jgi:ketosteroid isomerase-like protein